MHKLALIFTIGLSAYAQQTIFDVPSADVSGKNEWFYQHQTVLRTWNPGKAWVQTHAAGFGVGHEVELDATWFNLDLTSPKQSLGSFGFKWSPYLNDREAKVPLRLVTGSNVQARTTEPNLGEWSYVMLSADSHALHTTFTGGVNHGSTMLFGERTVGVLAGVEHHLNHKWMLQADWFSGKHDLAYLIPGVVYRTTPHWMVSLGYQIPNHNSHGHGAVVFELTRTP